ncbi:MAG: major Facilitator Superfamily protein [Anaerocolumna sp.]|nr:major Facilitator Superfamily protein [Anaerocolumna sp.]
MEKLARQLTLRYSFIQASYWICQCAINSFAAIFLQSKNFSNTQIGLVLALAAILSIVLQPVIASFADKAKTMSLRTIILLLMCTVFFLTILLYVLPDTFLIISVIFVAINAIQFTLNPLYNSLALEYMNMGVPMNYGLARGMGSITFAVMSSTLGYLVSHFSAEVILPVFLIGYSLSILSTYVFKVTIPENLLASIPKRSAATDDSTSDTSADAPTGIFTFFIKYKKFVLFLLGVAMLFYSHSLINTYLINIMENVGGNSSDMGISLSIAAALELPTMALFIYIVRKIKCSSLLKIGAFFFLVKAIVTLMAPNVFMVHFSQAFQLFAFALFTPASIYYVNDLVSENDRVKGQSMLGAAYLGIAGTVANVTGGRILDTFGVSEMLLLGTAVTAVGVVLICVSVTEKKIVANNN